LIIQAQLSITDPTTLATGDIDFFATGTGNFDFVPDPHTYSLGHEK